MPAKVCLLIVFMGVIFGFSQPIKAAPKPDTLMLCLCPDSDEGYDPTAGWGSYGSPLFQSTILAYDEDFNIIGDLAEAYSLSDDGLIWSIKIRHDARFTDGRPLTTQDIAYTFQTASKAAALIDLSGLDDVLIKGPYELEIRLKAPQITFINHLIRLGIVPKHLHDSSYARRPIGSGPFKFVDWDEDQQLIVERNDDYYGPKPDFKRIVFLFMTESSAFAAAKSGQLHVALVPHHLARQTIPHMTLKTVKSVDNRGIFFPVQPDTGLKSSNGFPIGNNITADPAIRRAVNYAINRKALVDGVLYGLGSPAYGLADNLPWDNPQIRFQDNDPDKARKILAEAGWVDSDGDGLVEKNGIAASLELVYPANELTRQRLALIVAQQVRKIGIEFKPLGMTWENIYNHYHFSNPILYGWGDTTPQELIKIYHSRTYDNHPDSTSYNPGRYNNKAVDGYLDRAEKSKSFEESLEFWKLAQWDGQTGPGVMGDATTAWLVNIDHPYFVDNDLDIGKTPIEPHGSGWTLLNNIHKWKWIGH